VALASFAAAHGDRPVARGISTGELGCLGDDVGAHAVDEETAVVFALLTIGDLQLLDDGFKVGRTAPIGLVQLGEGVIEPVGDALDGRAIGVLASAAIDEHSITWALGDFAVVECRGQVVAFRAVAGRTVRCRRVAGAQACEDESQSRGAKRGHAPV
jgi:hypothetical protein